jgi:hypothetical protein
MQLPLLSRDEMTAAGPGRVLRGYALLVPTYGTNGVSARQIQNGRVMADVTIVFGSTPCEVWCTPGNRKNFMGQIHDYLFRVI